MSHCPFGRPDKDTKTPHCSFESQSKVGKTYFLGCSPMGPVLAPSCLSLLRGPWVERILNKSRMHERCLLKRILSGIESGKRETSNTSFLCLTAKKQMISPHKETRGNHTDVTTADLQTFLLVCESSSTADIVSVAANMTPWQPSWLTMHRRACTRIRSNLLESHSRAVRASFETPGFPLGGGHATCSGGAALSSLRQPLHLTDVCKSQKEISDFQLRWPSATTWNKR